jgi:hypothetical protein
MNNTLRNPGASHGFGTDLVGSNTLIIGMALMFIVFAFSIIGDDLRDALDPDSGGQI